MLSPQEALDRAQDLADRARKAGADAADAVFGASSSEGIQVRLGNLEDVERSESEHISLRVFVGRRSASIGSSDLSPQALDELAARALSMAKAAPEDAFAGLAPEDLLTRAPWPELDLLDPAEPSPQALRAAALEAEEAARAIAGVSNSDGATASAGSGVFALATSHGFAGAYGSTSHSVSVSIVAGEGSAKQRDYAWRSAHHREDLPPPAEIGALAGERAVARLNPGRMASGPMPVVFDPRVGGSLIGHLTGAISGSAIARRSSFLLDRLEEQIFAPGIVLVEEPHTRRGLRSRPFDGEGLATRTRNLVEDGRLTGWLLDSASARQLGLAPTGHAARGGGGAPGVSVGNLHLQPGTATPEALMADIEDGVYITELIGHGVNGVTGDYSRGASGFRIVGGQIAGPIAEFTVAGNLLAMFAGLSAANDLEWHRAINVPTLRVDGMTIAGD
ncbi:microcin-processing peptidase 1 [Novosphingobium sp. PhB57]|jgi:PmbA protein|uniref:TldD/PmbA family protein n=1 Tax=unclassified Novosphingobium TaxID=2644732 RepID=UPI0010503B5D|nr:MULTISPECIES: TldD/PmbA family protein [unclassified Novosphingobium]TCU59689.1 microcin-processing peptidase 1 [Novosphingobium sp. PhB57]TDW63646.1 microcin-processing peptidase 1 [Novosphingobium sp. PhB55]